MLMDRIALALLIVGGVNWGSVGLFRFDIVAWLFGGQTATVSRVTRRNKRECEGTLFYFIKR